MNAFSFLKSGASFSRPRVQKLDKLFKPVDKAAVLKADKKAKAEAMLIEDPDEIILRELDEKIEANKTATTEA